MNFIFDIGNVLLEFSPRQFLHTLFDETVDVEAINQIIFKSKEWLMLDEGIISQDEVTDYFCMHNKILANQIRQTMAQLPEMLVPIPETVAFLPKIKALGHNLYFLSNFHKKLSRDILEKYPFWQLFNGGIFSCDVHKLKPNPEIYQALLDQYHLSAADCIFFDDTQINVDAANMLGIRGVLFTKPTDIEKYII